MECSHVTGDRSGNIAGGLTSLPEKPEGLSPDLLRKIFQYLSGSEQESMSLVCKEFGELAMMDPPDLLEDLESLHKDLTELLNNPLFEQEMRRANQENEGKGEGIRLQLMQCEEILRRRLQRRASDKVLECELARDPRHLSKKEASIYEELMQLSDEALRYLGDRLPAHCKVVREIVACRKIVAKNPIALFPLDREDVKQLAKWADKRKFELLKMVQEHGDFNKKFMIAIQTTEYKERAYFLATTIPDRATRREARWYFFKEYLKADDCEKAFTVAKEVCRDRNPLQQESEARVLEYPFFGEIVQKFAEKENWDRVKEALDLLEGDPDVKYETLIQLATSRPGKKGNLEIALKAMQMWHSSPIVETYFPRIARDLILEKRDYEGAKELLQGIAHSVMREQELVFIEIFWLAVEGKVGEAEAIASSMEERDKKDRALSMIALSFAYEGNQEEAMRYYRQISEDAWSIESCCGDIDKYLLGKR